MKVYGPLLLVALVASWGGCLDGPSIPNLIELHAFEAIAKAGDETEHLSFRGPIQIEAAGGQSMAAYAFQVTPENMVLDARIYYLDAGFRVVREDRWCRVEEQHCERYQRSSFHRAGRISPYGLGLDWLLNHERVPESLAPGRAGPLVVSQTPAGEAVTLRVLAGDGFAPVMKLNTSMTYVAGQMLPSQAGFAIIDYTVGAVMNEADLWRPPSLLAGVKDNSVFPGADVDAFGIGATPQAFFDALREDGVAAQMLASGGCFMQFRVDPRQNMSAVGSSVEADFLLVRAGEQQLFAIEAQNLAATVKFTVTRGARTSSPFSCDDVDASPWPATRFDDAIGEMLDIGGSYSDVQEASVLAWIGANGALRPMDQGAFVYALAMIPSFVEDLPRGPGTSFVNYELYSLGFDPHRGTLAYATMAPGDIR